jgi:ribonuclease HIII
MNSITLILNENQIKKLIETYKSSLNEKIPPYAKYLLIVENCRITIYNSNKVLFQGKDAIVYASAFDNTLVVEKQINKMKVPTKKRENSKNIFNIDTAGSDEVGTGDYFGPVVVCAAIVTVEDIKRLQDFKITDSKKLTDEYILEVAPEIMKFINYSCLVLGNKKYNEIHNKYNLNAIKAILHNQAYLNLEKEHKMPKYCYVDQFAPENLYFRYLKDQPKIYNRLIFETKAESKYIAVAVASMIARYTFLKKWDEINEFYEIILHKGAGDKVNQDAQKFVDIYGFKRLNEVAKLHFKNTDLINLK